MAGYVRRFNPGHQWIYERITAGELHLQQLQAHTYFCHECARPAAQLSRPPASVDVAVAKFKHSAAMGMRNQQRQQPQIIGCSIR